MPASFGEKVISLTGISGKQINTENDILLLKFYIWFAVSAVEDQENQKILTKEGEMIETSDITPRFMKTTKGYRWISNI